MSLKVYIKLSLNISIYTADQMNVFYRKCNNELNWINSFMTEAAII